MVKFWTFPSHLLCFSLLTTYTHLTRLKPSGNCSPVLGINWQIQCQVSGFCHGVVTVFTLLGPLLCDIPEQPRPQIQCHHLLIKMWWAQIMLKVCHIHCLSVHKYKSSRSSAAFWPEILKHNPEHSVMWNRVWSVKRSVSPGNAALHTVPVSEAENKDFPYRNKSSSQNWNVRLHSIHTQLVFK